MCRPNCHRWVDHLTQAFVGVAGLLALAGCATDPTGTSTGDQSKAAGQLTCTIPDSLISGSGAARGGIPALTNPEVIAVSARGPDWLEAETRVVGVTVEDTAIAVPMNILWYHEVVNFDLQSRPITVSHCPLTGSTLVFDRSSINGQHFVVTGLVYMSNLIMATRETGKSLFPQMEEAFRCGPQTGLELDMVSYLLTGWGRWQELHPETSVLSARTGYDRNYKDYPYGRYRNLHNPTTAYPVPGWDRRRPPKEMVLGIPSMQRTQVGEHKRRGIAVPYRELAKQGRKAAVSIRESGARYVLLWDSEDSTAQAFRPRVASDSGSVRRLHFHVRQGEFRDVETGSRWRMDGVAVGGELQGSRLEQARSPYSAFWFAWALFHPDTDIWRAKREGTEGQ